MRYQSSQSYRTLKHWQSGRKAETGPYTGYVSGTDNFMLQGFYDDSDDLVLFPWTLREEDAIAGDTWYGQTRSRYPFTAYYITPALDTVFAEKWTTADGYDVYYRVDKAGSNVHTIPGTVPWTGDAVTRQYAKCTRRQNSNGYWHIDIPTYEAYPNTGTSGWRIKYDGSFTLDGSYTGKVALPVVNRYRVWWNYYTAGTTDIETWCAACEDMGSTTENLGTADKWTNACVVAISVLCAKLHPYEWFKEVPRLKGLNPIVPTGPGNSYYRWPVLRGGNAGETSAQMYVAGADSATEMSSEEDIPYVMTGMDPATRILDYGIYQGQARNTAYGLTSIAPADSCVLAGDMGVPYLNGDMGYCPITTDYHNGYTPYIWVGSDVEGGIATIVRRIHDIEVQENFKFFT